MASHLLVAATRNEDAFDDRFPTQPIAVGRHSAAGPTRSTILVAVAVVIAAIVGALGFQSWAGSVPATSDVRDRDRDTAVGQADGVVPDGVTVFDDEFPAVAELDPALLKTLRRAAKDAGRNGITF